MKNSITRFIDIFYPIFRKIMPLQTFRYAVCGGVNTVLGLALYAFLLHYVFNFENVETSIMVFKPHNAALFCAFFFNLILGFLLNKFIVFDDSALRGRIQFFRYSISFFANLCINYFLLKIMVEILEWNAIGSQIIATIIIVILSYITQRKFSFRK